MGLTRYEKAVRVLKDYMDKTGKKYIHTIRLRNLMITHIGGDKNRTVLPNLQMMREQGIIEEVAIHKWKIKIK